MTLEKTGANENKPGRISARERAVQHLSRRDHSEAELRAKLSGSFDEIEIDDAVEYVRERHWLPTDTELSRRLVNALNEKGKGYVYISSSLEAKGLPAAPREAALERQKAQALIDSKLAKGASLDYEGKLKLQRFLNGRGFDEDTILEVLGSV